MLGSGREEGSRALTQDGLSFGHAEVSSLNSGYPLRSGLWGSVHHWLFFPSSFSLSLFCCVSCGIGFWNDGIPVNHVGKNYERLCSGINTVYAMEF